MTEKLYGYAVVSDSEESQPCVVFVREETAARYASAMNMKCGGGYQVVKVYYRMGEK